MLKIESLAMSETFSVSIQPLALMPLLCRCRSAQMLSDHAELDRQRQHTTAAPCNTTVDRALQGPSVRSVGSTLITLWDMNIMQNGFSVFIMPVTHSSYLLTACLAERVPSPSLDGLMKAVSSNVKNTETRSPSTSSHAALCSSST